jgi:hypothetical protein
VEALGHQVQLVTLLQWALAQVPEQVREAEEPGLVQDLVEQVLVLEQELAPEQVAAEQDLVEQDLVQVVAVEQVVALAAQELEQALVPVELVVAALEVQEPEPVDLVAAQVVDQEQEAVLLHAHNYMR